MHVLCWDDGIIEKVEKLNRKLKINLALMTNISMVSFSLCRYLFPTMIMSCFLKDIEFVKENAGLGREASTEAVVISHAIPL